MDVKKIRIWEDTGIHTYPELSEAYKWCVAQFGKPHEGRWEYGRYSPGFLGDWMINGPEDIEFLIFENDDDAMFFKLRWI